MRKVNRERIKKLRAEQFGTDGYREDIISLPCLVCARSPVDPAHVLKTRAAGGGPDGLAPLCRIHHTAFDSMGGERFEELYRVSKADIRAWARSHRESWEARHV